jgi:hypothetical protein
VEIKVCQVQTALAAIAGIAMVLADAVLIYL